MSQPTSAALQIRFPFLIIEGKAYATHQTLYQAQNQTAVSGACALNIVHDLLNLARKANPEKSQKTEPIIFSISTEGPVHEIWVHYMKIEEGHRSYQMKILKCSHMAVFNEVSAFMDMVENIVKWGCEAYLQTVIDDLKILWDAVQGGST